MKRFFFAVLLLVGVVPHAFATTWNPSDQVNVTLSNGNLTATIASANGTVRSTTSKTSGKFCTEATNTTAVTLLTFGFANSSLVLGSNQSSPNFIQVVPFDASAPQSLWLGGNELSSGASISAAGEAITVCADFNAKTMWFTDATMRAAGNPWNNSTTASPATGIGGASFSSIAGPYFVTFGSNGSGTAAVTLNPVGPFTVATPAGFTAWDGIPTGSNFLSDLSNAGAHPVTGFPSSKIAYSVHIYPYNVMGQTPDSPIATAAPVWNTYFGYLEIQGLAPVANLELGCSCDNSNGSLADDQAWGSAWDSYANGTAPGGPTFINNRQPMSNNWWSWGYHSGENPDGTLLSNGAINTGQQTYWSPLLYTPTGPTTGTTTWNPSDQSGISLSNNNLTASSLVSDSGVRSTIGKSTGKFCAELNATAAANGWIWGLADAAANLVNSAGSPDWLQITPFYPSYAQNIWLNNVALSIGTTLSTVPAKITGCFDLDNQLAWFTDAAMGAGVWNNSGAANPATGVGGVSFSGMSAPYYLAFGNGQASGTINSVAVLNTAGPFQVATPSGFTAWDVSTITGRALTLLFE